MKTVIHVFCCAVPEKNGYRGWGWKVDDAFRMQFCVSLSSLVDVIINYIHEREDGKEYTHFEFLFSPPCDMDYASLVTPNVVYCSSLSEVDRAAFANEFLKKILRTQ